MSDEILNGAAPLADAQPQGATFTVELPAGGVG